MGSVPPQDCSPDTAAAFAKLRFLDHLLHGRGRCARQGWLPVQSHDRILAPERAHYRIQRELSNLQDRRWLVPGLQSQLVRSLETT